jgi:glycosyltransferase involved in cell wall biosynthesis
MCSKALVIGAYQAKIKALAADPDLEIVAVSPASWAGTREGASGSLEGPGYRLLLTPIALNGSFHLFFFRRFGSLLDAHRPDLVHIDEEPYNLATFHAMIECRKRGIPALFFAWQNLNRGYPPPFSLMERYVYRRAAWGIAGTPAAERVLRSKGYSGPASVIPQFGVDPNLYRPLDPLRSAPRGQIRVGFAGRLVPEKGVELLLEASARHPGVRVTILGEGPSRPALESAANRLGLAGRVSFCGSVPSAEMPSHLQQLDALVLPSRTRPNWTEQFGRALVEAMACQVPVIGSESGEIPYVVGDAGLTFPEGDVEALTQRLQRLADDPELRSELGLRGRARVLRHFTHETVAEATVEVYRRALAGAGRGA